MSSRAKNMSKQIQAETREAKFRIDLKLNDSTCKSLYIILAGVPTPLPENMQNTVIYAARQQFTNVLNSRRYIELFNMGQTAAEENPVFYNLDKLDKIEVQQITEVEL